MKIFLIILGFVSALNSFACSWDAHEEANKMVNKVMRKYHLNSQDIVSFDWLEQSQFYRSPSNQTSCVDYEIVYLLVTYKKKNFECEVEVASKVPLNPIRLKDYFGYRKIISRDCVKESL